MKAKSLKETQIKKNIFFNNVNAKLKLIKC